MSNLLTETRATMKRLDLDPSNIIFIGSVRSGFEMIWGEFKTAADREYDDGFGSAKVALDLEIVFDNGIRMEREEYDGREWWKVSVPFARNREARKATEVFCQGTGRGGHQTLAECNGDWDDYDDSGEN